ncbi:MAG TPA: hypothetical protein VMM38_01510 [Aridibacter sp.]|nr:hypothetical protein [Aridibacter sp.]
MTDLRDHLFETIEMLKDGDMELDRAKAINEVARTLVSSAKVEVDAIKAIDATGSDFLNVHDGRFLPRAHNFDE